MFESEADPHACEAPRRGASAMKRHSYFETLFFCYDRCSDSARTPSDEIKNMACSAKIKLEQLLPMCFDNRVKVAHVLAIHKYDIG